MAARPAPPLPPPLLPPGGGAAAPRRAPRPLPGAGRVAAGRGPARVSFPLQADGGTRRTPNEPHLTAINSVAVAQRPAGSAAPGPEGRADAVGRCQEQPREI